MNETSFLESFDSECRLPPEHSSQFLAGFDEGLASAMKAQNEDQSKLTEKLLGIVQETQFTFTEARASVLQELKPLFAAITSQLFPQLEQECLVGQIIVELSSQAKKATSLPPQVTVHPRYVQAIRNAISSAGNDAVVVASAHDSPTSFAWVTHGQVRAVIDLEPFLKECENAFGLIASPLQQGIGYKNG